jgi:hypothetical protein
VSRAEDGASGGRVIRKKTKKNTNNSKNLKKCQIYQLNLLLPQPLPPLPQPLPLQL